MCVIACTEAGEGANVRTDGRTDGRMSAVNGPLAMESFAGEHARSREESPRAETRCRRTMNENTLLTVTLRDVVIYTIIKTTRLPVTEAVSVTGWRCTQSRPELETVKK